MDVLGEAEVNYLRAKLQAFLSRNPEADVRIGGRKPSVSRLWGEEAIEIPLRSDDEELFQALNAVRLPPRFTAIWHEDIGEFEVIFTVLNKENRLLGRKFTFRYRGAVTTVALAHPARDLGPSREKLDPQVARHTQIFGTSNHFIGSNTC